MSANTYYLELMSILQNIFSRRNWWTKPWRQRTYIWKKRREALEKKLGCKFIRVNTSNAKRGYDTDYEVNKIQVFISKFKYKKIKEKENKIKELEDKIKKLKLQLTNQSV